MHNKDDKANTVTNEVRPDTQAEGAWYVVATRPRQELVARDHLTRQGYRVLLPEISLKKRRQSRWVPVVEPLFPGYLFVQLAFGQDDAAPIRSTRGCRDLVRFGEHHPPVPAIVLEALMGQTDSVTEGGPLFTAGEAVRIEDGPFAGLTAVFDMPKGDDRAQVLLEMLGKVQQVVVDSDHLAKHVE